MVYRPARGIIERLVYNLLLVKDEIKNILCSWARSIELKHVQIINNIIYCLQLKI